MKDHPLVGATIESVNMLSSDEMSRKHWDISEPPAMILISRKAGRSKTEKDSVHRGRSRQRFEMISLFPAADPELNSQGTIFGEGRQGTGFYVFGSAKDDDDLRGLKILAVRPMILEELERQGWKLPFAGSIPPTVIELSDGSVIFPSRDPEGNGPGIWVVQSRDAEELL